MRMLEKQDLNRVRKEMGYGKKEFAVMLGMSPNTLHKLETSETKTVYSKTRIILEEVSKMYSLFTLDSENYKYYLFEFEFEGEKIPLKQRGFHLEHAKNLFEMSGIKYDSYRILGEVKQ